MAEWLARFPDEPAAALAVDLQEANRGGGSWPVAGYDGVLAGAATALGACRSAGLPVIYTATVLDPRGLDCQRFEPCDATGRPLATVAGDAETAISPEVAPASADYVVAKPRFSAFYASYLPAVLGRLGCRHLIAFGTFTEACLTTTVFDALWRDYRVTLVPDACGAATEAVHRAGLVNLANWLYGGYCVRSDRLASALAGQPFWGWRFPEPNSLPYSLASLDTAYGHLAG